jgi:beta-lactamase superfamily II metal-dependent hydrolase
MEQTPMKFGNYFLLFSSAASRAIRAVTTAIFLSTTLLAVPAATHAAAKSKPLQVYFVDVEGGQATLFVTPEGESLLIDTGWPGNASRDADRIAAAAKLAGIAKIDFVLLTHYHMDHAGGAPQLVAKIPVATFIDHGPNREPGDQPTEQAWQEYQKLIAANSAKRMTVKVGDVLPFKGIHAQVVSTDGVLLSKPIPGSGARNAACASIEKQPEDKSENARSLGTLFTFGRVQILDLGDLSWNKELELVCPVNKLGPMDVFIVSHHGSSQSNSPALLAAITPRLSIMDNGETKGGAPSSWDTVKNAPKLEDLWQLHYSKEGGAAHNSPDPFIANLEGPDAGNYLKLTVWPDGSMEVYNSRTQEAKKYTASHQAAD